MTENDLVLSFAWKGPVIFHVLVVYQTCQAWILWKFYDDDHDLYFGHGHVCDHCFSHEKIVLFHDLPSIFLFRSLNDVFLLSQSS